jgi:hypothetical protein
MKFNELAFTLMSPRPGAFDLVCAVPAHVETHFEARFLQRHRPDLRETLAVPPPVQAQLNALFKDIYAKQAEFSRLVTQAWMGPLAETLERLSAPLAQLHAFFRSFFLSIHPAYAVNETAWLTRQRALLKAYLVDASSDPDYG